MKLLVALDLSHSTHFLTEQVRKIAKATPSEIWLLYVAEPEPDFLSYDTGPQTVRDSVAKRFHREHRELQQLAESFRDQGITCTALLIQGAITETILAEAEKLQVDQILVGSYGKGFLQRLILGSTCLDVLNHAKIPVLVVPPQ